MHLTFRPAQPEDASELALLHTAVSADLTLRFGQGPWSAVTSERGIVFALTNSRITVAIYRGGIAGTYRLQSKKPWAIDIAYFTPVKKAVYLTGMAVTPAMQRMGIGSQLLDRSLVEAKSWPAEAIRLDAYDAEAGAGQFYAKRGLREMGRAIYRQAPLVYFEKTFV
jgi:GNAT superfamily N-acetyltransferase